MKKIIVISMVALVGLVFTGTAFAAITIGADSIAVGESTFSSSTNVDMNVSTTNVAYTATAAHSSGQFGYATTQDVSVIKSDSKVDGTPTASGTAGDLPSGYTE